jgi:Domain of unknown function (DUF4340)
MNARRVAWLLAAGLLVIAFAIWLSSLRHLERATLSGDLVLPGLEHAINNVTQVRIARADDTHATLVRAADGSWAVAERGWPAQVNKVRKLLLDLGALNVVEEKTRLAANYPALGVEELSTPQAHGTEVTVTSPAQTWALIVGKPSGGKSGYVRVKAAPQTLLAAPLLNVDAAPKSWLVTALLDLPAERVREIEEQPGTPGAYRASRQKTDDAHFNVAPLPKGRELSGAAAADSLGAALSGLNLEDVLKVDAAVSAAAHAVFRTFDGLEVAVDGRKDGARALIRLSAHAASAAANEEAQKLQLRLSGWEFEIPDYKYAAIFTPVTDLLKPLPQPREKSPAALKAAPRAVPKT